MNETQGARLEQIRGGISLHSGVQIYAFHRDQEELPVRCFGYKHFAWVQKVIE